MIQSPNLLLRDIPIFTSFFLLMAKTIKTNWNKQPSISVLSTISFISKWFLNMGQRMFVFIWNWPDFILPNCSTSSSHQCLLSAPSPQLHLHWTFTTSYVLCGGRKWYPNDFSWSWRSLPMCTGYSHFFFCVSSYIFLSIITLLTVFIISFSIKKLLFLGNQICIHFPPKLLFCLRRYSYLSDYSGITLSFSCWIRLEMTTDMIWSVARGEV